MINLGDKVADRITGFNGIAVSKIEHINGCIRYEVKPDKLKDGKTIESEWVDIGQLTVVKKSIFEKVKQSIKIPGGPGSIPHDKKPGT